LLEKRFNLLSKGDSSPMIELHVLIIIKLSAIIPFSSGHYLQIF
jgi:hypothetical protein